ncbi:MAG: hypothetical protein AAGC81_04695 [Pseudomonadota bacterium]
MAQVTRFLILLAALLISAPKADAYDSAYLKEVFDRYKSHVHPAILNAINSSARNKLKNVELVYIENYKLVTLAATDVDKGEIYISSGFLNGLYQTADCLLLEGTFKVDDLCDNYFDFFLPVSIDPDETTPPFTVAQILLNFDDTKITEWTQHEATDKARKRMLFAALINVMTHEMGHHIVGGITPGMTVPQVKAIESKADDWTYSTLSQIGQPPLLGAAVSLFYVAQWEHYRARLAAENAGNPDFRQLPSIHPRPGDRARKAFGTTCDEESSEPALARACDLMRRTIARMP